MLRVADLIDHESLSWRADTVRSIFSPEESTLILGMPLRSHASFDPWIWHFSSTGKFSVRTAYHTILASGLLPRQLPPSNQSPQDNVWKIIWSLQIPPRIKHFLWRVCSNSLPSPENCLKRNINVNMQCPFCSSHLAELHHLLFTCSFSQDVWQLSGLYSLICGFAQPTVDRWTKTVLLTLPTPSLRLFAIVLNNLWYWRNKRIFSGETISAHSLLVSSRLLLHAYQDALSISSPMLGSLPSQRPEGPCFSFDGAIRLHPPLAGVGVASWDENGQFNQGISLQFPGITDPLLAEFLALRRAMQFALSQGVLNPTFVGDSAVAILVALGELDCPNSCVPVLEDILSLKSSFSSTCFSWFSRVSNAVAHSFAHFAKQLVGTKIFWNSLPPFIVQSPLDVFQQI